MSKNNNYCYVTLFRSDSYLYPLIANYCSWKNTNSKYPFVLLVSDCVSDFNIDIVSKLGFKIVKIKEFVPTNYIKLLDTVETNSDIWDWHGKNSTDSGWRHAFSKVEAYTLTEYEKVLFIDADVFWFKNMDDIFEYPTMSSVNWQFDQFCSGFMLIKPSLEESIILHDYFNNYMPKVNEPKVYDDYLVYQAYYNKNWNKLPNYYFYNSFWLNTANTNTLLNDYCNIRSVHITGPEKPWRCGKQCIKNYSADWQIYSVFWNFYIDFLNKAIEVNSIPINKIDW